MRPEALPIRDFYTKAHRLTCNYRQSPDLNEGSELLILLRRQLVPRDARLPENKSVHQSQRFLASNANCPPSRLSGGVKVIFYIIENRVVPIKTFCYLISMTLRPLSSLLASNSLLLINIIITIIIIESSYYYRKTRLPTARSIPQ